MSNAFRGENPAFASLISADIGRGEVFPANVENRGLKALQSPILTTKTNNGIQPKPNAVCSFVTQSYSTDADFVIFFKLLSYRHTGKPPLFYWCRQTRTRTNQIRMSGGHPGPPAQKLVATIV